MQFGRPDVLDSALHARARARGRAPARLPRPAFKSRQFLCCSRLTALPHRLSCSTSLAQTIFLKNQALERVADASSVSSARLNSLRTAPGRPRAARVRRARAFYINPASARARLIGWPGRRFKLAGDRFWAPVAKRAVSARPGVRGCCAWTQWTHRRRWNRRNRSTASLERPSNLNFRDRWGVPSAVALVVWPSVALRGGRSARRMWSSKLKFGVPRL